VVLHALDDKRVKPNLKAMRSVALRIPLLVALGQVSVAVIELRRFLELSIWSIFFTHHPIEWEHFRGKKGVGFTRDLRKPIAYAAHRDLNSYIEYASEYMELEPSGFALKALAQLESDKRLLNSAVHAGDIARSPISNVPVDSLNEPALATFAKLQRRLFTHSIILAAAFNRGKFDVLTPEARAYWQWLLGVELQKKIRASDFGIYL